MPLFLILDAQTLLPALGSAGRNGFLILDLILWVFFLAERLAIYFYPILERHYARPMLFLTAGSLLVTQTGILFIYPDFGKPYLLVAVIFSTAAMVHMPARGLMAWLVVSVAIAIIPVGFGPYDPLTLLPALLATCTASLVAGYYRARNLDHQIELRRKTVSLARSLHDLRQLKLRQDGDYFLTSLLVRPLGGLYAPSRWVELDAVTRQKKSFRFRDRDVEIGGDLCAAYRFPLQGRQLIAFLNGDAMGKSVQGAGGALVLGTVFKSMVSRSQHSAQAQNRSPELWLKDCYNQLQDVFTSFEGSMTATAVYGLIDEKVGLVYYVNAEHPRGVLYRDGRAHFALSEEYVMNQFGMHGAGKPFQINLVALQPGDVMVLGSDGRHDIVLHEAGGLNEDESLFLRCVEAGQGNLAAITDAILAAGLPDDDLSMLSIQYRKEESGVWNMPPPGYLHLKLKGRALMAQRRWTEALETFGRALAFKDDDPELYRLMASAQLRVRRVREASRLLENYVWLAPMENEGLFLASYAIRATYLLEGNVPLEKGIDLGERCRLRDREHVRNLLNLAELYRLNSDYRQARKILEEALSVEPHNARARRLGRTLFYRDMRRY